MAEKLFKAKIEGIPNVDAKIGGNVGLADRIENTLTRVIQNVMRWSWDFIGELLVNVIDYGFKILKPGMLRMFNPLFDEVLKDEAYPPMLKTLINNARKEEGEAAVLGLVTMALSLVLGVFSGGLAPMGRRLEHVADVIVRSYVPGPNDLSLYKRLGLITDQVYQKAMWNNGVPEDFRVMIEEMSRNLPTTGEMIQGRWRGAVTDAEFAAYTKRMGYDEKGLAVFNALSKQLPGMSDLIHFMVREAFNDATSNKFGYDADYPGALDPYLKQLGFDPDWGKRFWRAHWVLPSPTQAYEMLHRGLIDAATLSELLKTSDYPEFWRDKLEKISYNTYTRVDVRRLMQAGTLSYDEGLQAYKDMGYTEEKARKLTDFAAAGITQDERDLTRTDIINMYEDNLIDRGAAASALVKMGYDGAEAEDILKLADLNIAKANRTDAINYVKERYVAYKIDRNGAANELAQAGLKVQGVERYLLAWDRSMESAEKIPSPADAKRFYLSDLIDELGYRDLMKQNGYSAKNIELYVSLANIAKNAPEV